VRKKRELPIVLSWVQERILARPAAGSFTPIYTQRKLVFISLLINYDEKLADLIILPLVTTSGLPIK
jgi:hypothetical protein